MRREDQRIQNEHRIQQERKATVDRTFQRQDDPAARKKNEATTFDALLDAWEREPERWDGLA